MVASAVLRMEMEASVGEKQRRMAVMNELIEALVKDASELPDRTSPEDRPDLLLLTRDELRAYLKHVAEVAAEPSRDGRGPSNRTGEEPWKTTITTTPTTTPAWGGMTMTKTAKRTSERRPDPPHSIFRTRREKTSR